MLDLIVGLIMGGCLGTGAGAYATVRYMQKVMRKRSNIDYKERWLEALKLIEGEGRLTHQELTSLTRGEPDAPAIAVTDKDATLQMLHTMSSYHRAEAEIARAKKRLPPLDDLAGMQSYHKSEVLQARIEYGTSK